jgi:filamentous hemagglutinin
LLAVTAPSKIAAGGKDAGKAATVNNVENAANAASQAAKGAKGSNFGSAADNIYAEMKPLETVFPELKGVNPYYIEDAAVAVNTNCISCVNAAHQRLTGQNPAAVANPSKGYGTPNDLLPSSPLGFGEVTTPAAVVKEMLQAGNGVARPLIIEQNNGISHVINVVNRNGQVYFIDPQIGKIVTLQQNINVKLGAGTP